MTDKSPFDLKALGQAVRHVRTQKGWTQEMLSEVSTHTQRTICSIERGQISTTIVTLENVARALDTSAPELIQLGDQLKMAKEPILRTIYAKNVRNRRKKLLMTQESLARKANVSLNYVHKIESGKNSATLDKLEIFAEALNTSPVLLISE